MTHRDYAFQSPFIPLLTLNQSDSMSMHSKAAEYVSQTEIRFNQLIKKCQSSRQSTFAMCVVPTSSCDPSPHSLRKSGLQDPASWLTPNLSGAQPHTDAQIQRYTQILRYSDAQILVLTASQFWMQAAIYELVVDTRQLALARAPSHQSYWHCFFYFYTFFFDVVKKKTKNKTKSVAMCECAPKQLKQFNRSRSRTRPIEFPRTPSLRIFWGWVKPSGVP